jgi:lysophospholipase L1-like esterase
MARFPAPVQTLVALTLALLSSLSSSHSSARGEDFFFRDGDRVVMIGDSITEQHLYSNYVEMWTVTRFPQWKLTFRNVGIGGDRSPGGNDRFARDVLLHQPTAMTVDFGMNDGSYREFTEETFKPYMDGLQGMADQARAANVRVAWVTPQPLDEDQQGPTALTGYNLTLEKFSAGVKSVAERNQGLFVDQFHPYLAVLDLARSRQNPYRRITDGDAVHPGPPGQALMAASILQGLRFPTLVSSVEIDLTENTPVLRAQNCQVGQLVDAEDSLRFERLDRALPFFPEDAASILEWTPLLESMNQYLLKVTGLPGGRYQVKVDGVRVGERTADELASGTNLAADVLKAGPIADKVRSVREAVENKNRFYHDRLFRGATLADVPEFVRQQIPGEQIESLRTKFVQEQLPSVATLDAEVAARLQLKPHTFELTRLP